MKGYFLPKQIMILCEICGNKRCPHANDKNFKCTNSNETGQAGSRYTMDSKANIELIPFISCR